MAHKYPNLLIHLVFSTKDRRALIPDQLRPVLWKYLSGIGIDSVIFYTGTVVFRLGLKNGTGTTVAVVVIRCASIVNSI